MLFFLLTIVANLVCYTMQQGEISVINIKSMRELNSTINHNDFVLIAFVTSGCSKAGTLTANLQWAASRLARDSIKARMAKVDLSVLPHHEAAAVKSTFGVEGTPPALKWAAGGQISSFDGHSSANGIHEWVHRCCWKVSVVC